MCECLRLAEEEKPVNREEMERSGEGSAPNGSGSGNGNGTEPNSKDGHGDSRHASAHSMTWRAKNMLHRHARAATFLPTRTETVGLAGS